MKARAFRFFKWLGAIALILGAATLFVRTNLFMVSGSNMEPAYGDYDFGFISRFADTYHRYDVVLYTRDGNYTNISRIVGLPGEKVEIKENGLFINGSPVDMTEYWRNQPKAFGTFSRTLESTEYALMSDNGHDGEQVRIITASMIKGRYIYLPFIH